MVHHGHKTDVQEHVLINQMTHKNFSKAQKHLFLCFCVCTALGLKSTPVAAQLTDAPVYAASGAADAEIRLQQMETQIRELTGKVEEQVYEINSLKNKVKRLQSDIVEIDNAAVNTPPASAQPQASNNPLGLDFKAQEPRGMQSKTVVKSNPDATAQYENAFASLKNKDYKAAEDGFSGFLETHSDHILAANAKYWLGETHYVRGDYKQAARIFAEGFQAYPDSAKSPDILFKLGLSLKGMGKDQDACVALAQVPVKFPAGNDSIVKLSEEERAKLSCNS